MQTMLFRTFGNYSGPTKVCVTVVFVQILLFALCVLEDLRDNRFRSPLGIIVRDRMTWSIQRIFFAIILELIIAYGICYSLFVDNRFYEMIREDAPVVLIIVTAVFLLWILCIRRYFTVEHYINLFSGACESVPRTKRKNIQNKTEGIAVINRYIEKNMDWLTLEEKKGLPNIKAKVGNYQEIEALIDVIKKIEYEMDAVNSTVPFYVCIDDSRCELLNFDRFAVYTDHYGNYNDRLYQLYYRYYLQVRVFAENFNLDEYEKLCNNRYISSILLECERKNISVIRCLYPVHFLR